MIIFSLCIKVAMLYNVRQSTQGRRPAKGAFKPQQKSIVIFVKEGKQELVQWKRRDFYLFFHSFFSFFLLVCKIEMYFEFWINFWLVNMIQNLPNVESIQDKISIFCIFKVTRFGEMHLYDDFLRKVQII